MKRILFTANFLIFVALGVHACDKNTESSKNPFKSFINACAKKIPTIANKSKQLKSKILTLLQNLTQQEVVESNVLNTDISEPKFAMFADMPKEIIKDQIMPSVTIMPTKPQSFTQQEVGKSNVLNTDTSEPKFAMFADMPEEIIKDHIMTELDIKSFLCFAQASKQLWNLADLLKKQQRTLFKNIVKSKSNELDLSNMNLNAIYPNVFNSPEFKNVKTLNLTYNNLTRLGKNTFNGLENLNKLQLSFNSMIELDQDTFNALVNMRHLDLDNNKLKHLDKQIFRNCKDLGFLDVRHTLINQKNIDVLARPDHQLVIPVSNEIELGESDLTQDDTFSINRIDEERNEASLQYLERRLNGRPCSVWEDEEKKDGILVTSRRNIYVCFNMTLSKLATENSKITKEI